MVTTSRDSGAGAYSHGTACPSPSPQLAAGLSSVRATALFVSLVIERIIAPGLVVTELVRERRTRDARPGCSLTAPSPRPEDRIPDEPPCGRRRAAGWPARRPRDPGGQPARPAEDEQGPRGDRADEPRARRARGRGSRRRRGDLASRRRHGRRRHPAGADRRLAAPP